MKTLIVRLSSLGDVVLATAALEALPPGEKADWVVSREFAELLEGHPRIGRVWDFDRKGGLKAWLALGRLLWNERYDRVVDLHSSLRTRILALQFRSLSGARSPRPEWTRAPKPRIRLWGYFWLKSLWPERLRPAALSRRLAMSAGGKGDEKPDFRHLAGRSTEAWAGGPYYCVMPSAQWEGKRWGADRFFEVMKRLPQLPVILGGAGDEESLRLEKMMKDAGLAHVSGVGRWNLRQVAQVLSGSLGILSNDTGLAHLAEAVGVPAYVAFGPTVPEMGFGPWRAESRAIGAELWCRPCGKDGRYCFRLLDRYACMKRLEPSAFLEAISHARMASERAARVDPT